MKHVPLPWSLITAFTTGSKKFHPLTGWMPASQFKRVRFILETISLQANMSIVVAYQLANVENAPGTPVAIGTAITTGTVTYGILTDISADIDDYKLIRFGVDCENTSAATLITGRVGGLIEYLSY